MKAFVIKFVFESYNFYLKPTKLFIMWGIDTLESFFSAVIKMFA